MLDDGTECPVPVIIDQPIEKDRHWECHFTIDWPEAPYSKYAGGVDALQALCSALRLVTTMLYVSPYHEAGKLRWGKFGGGYGFLATRAFRDVLVGHDRYFEGEGAQDEADLGPSEPADGNVHLRPPI